MKNLPLFSTPQNNKTPLLRPAKTCHEKINGERCSWSLFCLSRGKHPHLSLDQSCPTGAAGTRRGTGQGLSCSNMARSCSQQLCPHQHCWRIGRDPSHPFWDHQATGAHPPSTQSSLRDGGKRLRALKPSQAVVQHGSDAVLGCTRGTSSPPGASGRIFPSLPRLPGIPTTPSHRSEPSPCWGETPKALGVESPSPGVARAGAMPGAVFSRRDERGLFCRECGDSRWKGTGREGVPTLTLQALINRVN